MPEEMNGEIPERKQLNVRISDRTWDLLEDAVAKYGGRHENAKQRNRAAADILNKFIDVWIAYLEDQDEALKVKQKELIGRYRQE